ARAGTLDGLMNHTVSSQSWQNLWFNDVLVGEIGINAALCGAFGCPVLLVTGDRASCREGSELLGAGLTTVPVKEAIGRTSARHVAPVRARQMIEEAARECLSNPAAVAPYRPGPPAAIRVEFVNTARWVIKNLTEREVFIHEGLRPSRYPCRRGRSLCGFGSGTSWQPN